MSVQLNLKPFRITDYKPEQLVVEPNGTVFNYAPYSADTDEYLISYTTDQKGNPRTIKVDGFGIANKEVKVKSRRESFCKQFKLYTNVELTKDEDLVALRFKTEVQGRVVFLSDLELLKPLFDLYRAGDLKDYGFSEERCKTFILVRRSQRVNILSNLYSNWHLVEDYLSTLVTAD